MIDLDIFYSRAGHVTPQVTMIAMGKEEVDMVLY